MIIPAPVIITRFPTPQSVTTRPSKHRSGSNGGVEEGDDVHGESRTFWTESLIATLCCFPIGIVSLCYSLEVRTDRNTMWSISIAIVQSV